MGAMSCAMVIIYREDSSHFEWRSGIRSRTLGVNISGSNDGIAVFLGLFESPFRRLHAIQKS